MSRPKGSTRRRSSRCGRSYVRSRSATPCSFRATTSSRSARAATGCWCSMPGAWSRTARRRNCPRGCSAHGASRSRCGAMVTARPTACVRSRACAPSRAPMATRASSSSLSRPRTTCGRKSVAHSCWRATMSSGSMRAARNWRPSSSSWCKDVRATWTIFRRELAAYLASPLGWIVAATVLLLDGLLFYAQALGPAAGERLSAEVLSRFFWTTSGLVAIAAVALSVRLLVEERQLDTLVLLNTSPVRDREIVLGKFLSAFAFLGGITLLTLYMPLLVMVNGKISAGQIGVGYLGLFLIGGAVLAVGVFASSLT